MTYTTAQKNDMAIDWHLENLEDYMDFTDNEEDLDEATRSIAIVEALFSVFYTVPEVQAIVEKRVEEIIADERARRAQVTAIALAREAEREAEYQRLEDARVAAEEALCEFAS